MNIPEAVKKVVLRIVPDSKITLFGSRARGDAKSGSDWDFLVLTRQPLKEQTKDLLIGAVYQEVELKADEVISLVIFNEDEWVNHRYFTPLFLNIKEEGISL